MRNTDIDIANGISEDLGSIDYAEAVAEGFARRIMVGKDFTPEELEMYERYLGPIPEKTIKNHTKEMEKIKKRRRLSKS